MNPELHDEIARVAYSLYEQSSREEGKDLINWLAAEKIVRGCLAFPGRIPGEEKTAARQRRSRNGRRRRTDA